MEPSDQILVAVVCVFASLWCASSAYLDGAGREQLARQHGAASYADKAKVIAELESDVARLQAQALAEGRDRGCKQNCRAVNAQAAAASERLAAARAEKAAAKPVEASGMASAIAALTGGDVDETAWGIGVFKALLFLALIEALAWLSIPATGLLTGGRRSDGSAELTVTPTGPTDAPTGIVAPSRPCPVIIAPVRSAISARAGTAAYYRERLKRERPDLAAKVAGRSLSVYAASIEAGMRKAPAKSNWTTVDAYLAHAETISA